MKLALFTCFCLNVGILFSQTIIHEDVNLFELEADTVLSPKNLKGFDVKSILRYEVEFSENGKIDTLNVSQFILDTAGRVIFVETDGNSRQQWQKIKAYISYSKDTVNRTIYATALRANRYFRKDVQLSMRSTKVGDQYSLREYSVRNMRDSTIVRMEKDSFVRVSQYESVNYNYLFDYANKVMLLNEITTEKYNPQGDVVHRETEYFTKRYIESLEFHEKRQKKIITTWEYNEGVSAYNSYTLDADNRKIYASYQITQKEHNKLGTLVTVNDDESSNIQDFNFESMRIRDRKIDFSNDHISSTKYLSDSKLPEKVITVWVNDTINIVSFIYIR